MKRRRWKRYRGMKKNSGMKFLGFIGIIVGAVICGYVTARFIVAPLLGYDTEVLHMEFPSLINPRVAEEEEVHQSAQKETLENAEKTEKTENIEKTENASHIDQTEAAVSAEAAAEYVLQFGVFSAKSGAEQLAAQLKKENLDVRICHVDGSYKVVSESFSSKEAALNALKRIENKKNIDVFITALTDKKEEN